MLCMNARGRAGPSLARTTLQEQLGVGRAHIPAMPLQHPSAARSSRCCRRCRRWLAGAAAAASAAAGGGAGGWPALPGLATSSVLLSRPVAPGLGWICTAAAWGHCRCSSCSARCTPGAQRAARWQGNRQAAGRAGAGAPRPAPHSASHAAKASRLACVHTLPDRHGTCGTDVCKRCQPHRRAPRAKPRARPPNSRTKPVLVYCTAQGRSVDGGTNLVQAHMWCRPEVMP